MCSPDFSHPDSAFVLIIPLSAPGTVFQASSSSVQSCINTAPCVVDESCWVVAVIRREPLQYAQIGQKLYCNYRLLVEYDFLLCCSSENCNIAIFGCSLDEQESDVTDILLDSWVLYYVWVINWYSYTN